MNQALYKNRCKCNKTPLVTKKKNLSTVSKEKPLQYPQSKTTSFKTICIKCSHKFSLSTKLILTSFQNKYIFYAIDDIMYNFSLSLTEREILLSILYSPITYLQNHFSINFSEIWLHNIYIKENLVKNKFINPKSKKISYSTNYIIIQFFYKTEVPSLEQDSL